MSRNSSASDRAVNIVKGAEVIFVCDHVFFPIDHVADLLVCEVRNVHDRVGIGVVRIYGDPIALLHGLDGGGVFYQAAVYRFAVGLRSNQVRRRTIFIRRLWLNDFGAG